LNPFMPSGRVLARTSLDLPIAGRAPAQKRTAFGKGHVAVFVDRSPAAANAAWRAALVAHDLGLPLRVIALHPLHANLAQAAALADSLASDLRKKLDVQVTSHAIAGTREHEGVEATRDASLLVLPSGARSRPWAPGSPVLRMLRRTRRPVLLVRNPAHGSYRSVLAAVELDLDSRSLIAAALAMSRDGSLEVLHALDTSHEEIMQFTDVPVSVIRAQRERDADRVRRVLVDVIASAGASEHAEPVVAFGSAGPAITQHALASEADLVVIGKRLRLALVDALPGGAVQRALRSAGADVLVLPLLQVPPATSWHLPGVARLNDYPPVDKPSAWSRRQGPALSVPRS
jgi:nucleotide-binding universal stress UspA family protein